ncbi:hypothetical protein BJX61DRAFT_538315 [Aspergillus egyptiacus]|nr:hypothetical protein BJX61DRAFT_538315 [Aspergillus egyptiacus]
MSFHSRTPETPPSSAHDSAGYGNSPAENWSDSSSSSPEALMPYQQPWTVEPAMNYSLIPPQSPTDFPPGGLPRIVPSMGGGSPEWSAPLLASNNCSSTRLWKPETPPLAVAGKGPSDWVSSKAAEPLYRHSSLLVEAFPPHSAQSANPTTTTAATSLSPTLSTNMPYHSLSLSLVSPPIKVEGEHEDASPSATATMDESEDTNADPPYSQLIWNALMAAPGKKLPLQGIYAWFEKNTAKGRDRTSKGWQNSIRHNLSMNAGFEAVREESTPGKKAVSYWRLTEEAIREGVQSTTRYRKQTNYRKPVASDPPAPQRQRSGAKGGKATKITARFRSNGASTVSMSPDEYRRERERAYRQHQQYQQHQHRLYHSPHHPQHHHPHHHHQRVLPSQRRLPKDLIYNDNNSNHSQYLYQHHRPSPISTTSATTVPAGPLSSVYAPACTPATTTSPMTRSPAVEAFDLSALVGCTDARTHATPCTTPTIFSDMAEPSPDCLVFDTTGLMAWDGGLHSSSSFRTGGCGEISASDLHIGL